MHGDRGGSAGGAYLSEWARYVCCLPRITKDAADWGAYYFLRSHGGFVHWISVVQRASRGNFHGRCGVAGLGRRHRHGCRYDQTGAVAAVHRRGLRDRSALGDFAGWFVQAAQEAYFQDGADSSSLRVAGLVGVEGDCAVLDCIARVRAVCADYLETEMREPTTEARGHGEKLNS